MSDTTWDDVGKRFADLLKATLNGFAQREIRPGCPSRRRYRPAQERRQHGAHAQGKGALESAPAVAKAPLRAQCGAQVGVRDPMVRLELDRLAEAAFGLGVPALLEIGRA